MSKHRNRRRSARDTDTSDSEDEVDEADNATLDGTNDGEDHGDDDDDDEDEDEDEEEEEDGNAVSSNDQAARSLALEVGDEFRTGAHAIKSPAEPGTSEGSCQVDDENHDVTDNYEIIDDDDINDEDGEMDDAQASACETDVQCPPDLRDWLRRLSAMSGSLGDSSSLGPFRERELQRLVDQGMYVHSIATYGTVDYFPV